MGGTILQLVIYFGRIILLTLGTVVVCGLSVRLCARVFWRLLGNGADRILDVTSAIGTPIHELGHALMCPLFCHKIKKIRLWSPTAQGGTYGYVEHSYSKKNVWAVFGNLFIGVGPIFSGLGVVVLTLCLCFPNEWSEYLNATSAFSATGGGVRELSESVFYLLVSVVRALGGVWWRALLGIVVILSVALHVTLSWADVRSSLIALPIYLLLSAIFAAVTFAMGVKDMVTQALLLFNLRVFSLFCVVIAFAAVWVVIALLIRAWRVVLKWF